jgi:hypothetical protein
MIKTVYSQELNIIVKSKKSGAGTDDSYVYKPKLVWFENADSFFRSILAVKVEPGKLYLL